MSATDGSATPVASRIEAARLALIPTPANAPERDARWDDLYLLVVGPPPPNSVRLREVAA